MYKGTIVSLAVMLAALSGCLSPASNSDSESAIESLSTTASASAPEAAHRSCKSTGDCKVDEFCNFAPAHACGVDRSKGQCVPDTVDGFACTHIARDVCGCDGAKYLNDCWAHHAGVAVAFELPFPYDGDCYQGLAGATADGGASMDPIVAVCGGIAQYPNPPHCSIGTCVDSPGDSCDPAHGGIACPGYCIQ